LESGKPTAPKTRLVRSKKTPIAEIITKNLTKWLRKKPKRAAYWTGVVHGATGILVIVGAFFIASLLGTILVAIAVLGVAWVVSRRG
jgi:hypothetical protein